MEKKLVTVDTFFNLKYVTYVCIYKYINIHTHTHIYIYIYIYIYHEKSKEN